MLSIAFNVPIDTSKFLFSEVLTDPVIAAKLADTKASGEVKALDDFYTMLQTDPDKAFYGWVFGCFKVLL